MNRDQIKSLLMSDNRAVEKGIVAIFHRQTEDEKCDNATHHTNGRGFNYKDADYGSYLARWVINGRHLTGKHLAAARRMCCLYSRQLEEISADKLKENTISYKSGTLDDMDPFQPSAFGGTVGEFWQGSDPTLQYRRSA
jgi:hypothetical protein